MVVFDMAVKELLEDRLTKKELALVPSAFDVVGNIIIFSEFPKELIKKEKIIGEAFLKEFPNIKTICKKTKKYSGKFRTPTLKIISGEKNKETIHKENGVTLKLDVEKVYFSMRSANERLRIANLIKKDEEVLVMFSGCAPFPCVFAKKSPAKYIYGIEINPVAHKYAVENIKINKISNVFVINKDVTEAMPNFYQQIIGLKTSIKKKEIFSRIKKDPPIMEIYTEPSDFDKNFNKLRKTIKDFIKKNKYVVVHQPAFFLGGLDTAHYSIGHPVYSKMVELVKEFNIDIIIHINESSCNESKKIISSIVTFKNYYRNIFFENCTRGFGSKLEEINSIIEQTGLTNFCIDTCHLLHHYTSDELPAIIKKIQSKCNTYFHLSDYKDKKHAGKLSKGSNIDLRVVLPLITKGITEIKSTDEVSGKDMIRSWDYLKNFNKTFDRILMPLPKSAEEFLDLALKHTKKGTIIHFYDFLKENEFDKAKEKVAKACKKAKLKFKTLDLVKCGQFGPRIYRICLDFQII